MLGEQNWLEYTRRSNSERLGKPHNDHTQVFGPIDVHIVSYNRSLIGLILAFYEISKWSKCIACDVAGTARKRSENST